MLDIELFRTNLEKIIASENKRFKDPTNAEKVIEFDKKWRETLQELEETRKKRNEISAKIGEYKKRLRFPNLNFLTLMLDHILSEKIEHATSGTFEAKNIEKECLMP